jgi:anti-anti-sigma factor
MLLCPTYLSHSRTVNIRKKSDSNGRGRGVISAEREELGNDQLTKVEPKRLHNGITSSSADTQRGNQLSIGGFMLKVHARKADSVEILCLEGQIVNGDTEMLRSAVEFASDVSEIILDLSNVNLVDAHGLGVLLQLREQTLASGTHFELINVNEKVSRVFEITRLDTVFAIHSGAFIPKPTYAPQFRCAA